MATGARLSILGLYLNDNTLFDNLQLPEEVNKESFINYLILRTSELPLLYADADFMKNMIGVWSANRIQAWERIAIVLYEEYDPFINIKRDEERTTTTTRDLANTYKTNVNAWDDQSADGVLRDAGAGTDTGTVTTHDLYHLEGDSAITDAQDVAKKEVELRQNYNLINIIVNEFKTEFCLSIY